MKLIFQALLASLMVLILTGAATGSWMAWHPKQITANPVTGPSMFFTPDRGAAGGIDPIDTTAPMDTALEQRHTGKRFHRTGS